MCHMTVHIALDDQTEENGTLMFIPGSQNWHRGGLPLPITGTVVCMVSLSRACCGYRGTRTVCLHSLVVAICQAWSVFTADDFGDMNSILSVLTPEERAAFKPVPAMLKRGEASFHHPLLVHGTFQWLFYFG